MGGRHLKLINVFGGFNRYSRIQSFKVNSLTRFDAVIRLLENPHTRSR
jgi:hypothetical protein